MKSGVRALVVIVAIAIVPAARAADVLVFAAASTTTALDEINARFGANGGRTVGAVYESSGMLARQIENGAPADILISANQKWIEYLAMQRLLAADTKTPLVRNRLALIAPTNSKLDIEIGPQFPLIAKLGDGRLAIADPRHVPAGYYAKSALMALGVWRDIERRTALAHNVRAALALVERGEAPAGIVYTTDAAVSENVRLVGIFPGSAHPPIVYEAAIVAKRERPAVRAYFSFLKSAAAAEVFRKHGFEME